MNKTMIQEVKQDRKIIKYIIKDMKNAIKAYKKFRKYLVNKRTGDNSSRHDNAEKRLEHTNHYLYAYYLNDIMDKFGILFKSCQLNWNKYLNEHHIVYESDYTPIMLKWLKQNMKYLKEGQDNSNFSAEDQFNLLSTDLNYSNIKWNQHSEEKVTDNAINLITIKNIYCDVMGYLDDDTVKAYMKRKYPKILKYEHKWIKLCKEILSWYGTDSGLTINNVE